MSMENVDCHICKKRSHCKKSIVQCGHCQEWQHIHCTKLTPPEILHYQKFPEHNYYVCRVCLVDIFPFQTICNTELKEIFHIQQKTLFKQLSIVNGEPSLDELTKADYNYRSV